MTSDQTPHDPLAGYTQADLQMYTMAVLRSCFRDYAEASDLDTEQMTQVTMGDFVRWCRVHRSPLSKLQDFSQQGVPEVMVQVVWDQFINPGDDFVSALALSPLWDALRLSGRHALPAKASAIRLGCEIFFESKRVMGQQVALPLPDFLRSSEGMVLSFVQAAFAGLVATMKSPSLAHNYQHHTISVPEELAPRFERELSAGHQGCSPPWK